MDGVDNGLEHGFKLKPGFVSVGREAVAYEFGESGVGEVAFVDFLKADKLLPADEFHTLSYRVGYCNAVIGRGGNNVAAAVGFAVRANEADVDGVNDGLALSGELDLRILALGELPAVVIDEGHSGVHVVRDVRAAAILGAELVNEVLGFKGDVAVVLPVLQLNGSDFIAGLVGIHESPVVRSSRRDAIDIDVYQLVDFISSGRFGRAHDLAGDGGIASDFPSFRLGAPGQHECPFGVVGVIMPVRDLLIIGGKNEAVIRLDGANARREVYNNNAVVQIQMETLVVVLGIFVDAVEVYGELIQLILGRVTGLVGRRLGLLCLVNRGGGRSGHFADGDGVTHGVTGVSVLHRVGVVNVHGVISRDIDSDVATAFASGNELKRAVLAANLDGAAAFPHGVGDNDVLGGDVVEAANGDSVLKHIANSGRPLVVGNGNGLVYVKLGHRLGLSGLALDGEGDGRSVVADVLPVVIGVDVQQLAGLALGVESVGVIYILFRGYFNRASPLFSIPSFIEGVAVFNNTNSLVVFVVGFAVNNNANTADIGISCWFVWSLRLNRRVWLGGFTEVDFEYFVAFDANIQIVTIQSQNFSRTTAVNVSVNLNTFKFTGLYSVVCGIIVLASGEVTIHYAIIGVSVFPSIGFIANDRTGNRVIIGVCFFSTAICGNTGYIN